MGDPLHHHHIAVFVFWSSSFSPVPLPLSSIAVRFTCASHSLRQPSFALPWTNYSRAYTASLYTALPSVQPRSQSLTPGSKKNNHSSFIIAASFSRSQLT